MKFFIPRVSQHRTAQAYQTILKRLAVEWTGSFERRPYYSIVYSHEGTRVTARVGQPDPITGNTVVAIVRAEEADGPFFICTGGRKKTVHLASGSADTHAVPFDE